MRRRAAPAFPSSTLGVPETGILVYVHVRVEGDHNPVCSTGTAIQSIGMFCYGCWLKFRGSAWAVGNHSYGHPSMGTFRNMNFKTSRLAGWRPLYNLCSQPI